MRDCKQFKTSRTRGALALTVFVSLLLMLAIGIASGTPSYAAEDDNSTLEGPVDLVAQSEVDDIIAKYPELADLVLDHLVTRSEE